MKDRLVLGAGCRVLGEGILSDEGVKKFGAVEKVYLTAGHAKARYWYCDLCELCVIPMHRDAIFAVNGFLLFLQPQNIMNYLI